MKYKIVKMPGWFEVAQPRSKGSRRKGRAKNITKMKMFSVRILVEEANDS